jgi:putative hydrolase of the HAD superfamily
LKLRTITVDFWGTLLFDGPGSDNRYKRVRLIDFERILVANGIAVDRAALDRAYETSGEYLATIWRTHRDVPVEDHVRAILTALDRRLPERVPPPTVAQLLEAYARPALVVPPTVDDTALAALRALCGRGYTLALVSNTMRTPGATLRRLLAKYQLLDCFAHTTFSDEVGVRKPAAEIFHLTLRAVGGEPQTSVHVGDDTVLDVQGARAAGMRVIQVAHSRSASRGGPGPDAVIARLAHLPDAIAALEAS